MSKQNTYPPLANKILKLLNGQSTSSAIGYLNYCIQVIQNAAVFTYQGKSSSKSPSKGKAQQKS